MDMIISHDSALQYWRLNRNVKINANAKLRRKSLPGGIPKSAIIRNSAPSGLSYPINVMVGSQKANRRSKLVRIRVWSAIAPEWCFVKIDDEVYVSSPQYCFFQMAEELSLVKLIELGLELCGTYSLPAMDESDHESGHESGYGCLYNQTPLTSVKALKAFTVRMEGVNGRKKALRALRYVANGSASPMETIVFMFLTLSYKLGGYGLPKPELNKRIDIHKIAKQRLGRAFYKCDLYWPKANTAVEYDSDLHHTGPERIASDSIKRLDLKSLGIEVVTVTRRQMRNADEFENVAKAIAKNLGKRLWYMNPQFENARKNLRGLLL